MPAGLKQYMEVELFLRINLWLGDIIEHCVLMAPS
jgi:hypothetical protein